MGHRLGIYEGKRPDSLFEEGIAGRIVKAAGIFPKAPQLPREQWKKIVRYYREQAPREAPSPPPHDSLTTGLEGFRLRAPSFRADPPMTSLVKIGPQAARVYVGDAKADASTLTILNDQFTEENTVVLPSPPVALWVEGSDLFVTSMGQMPPTDTPSGRIMKLFLRPGETKYRSSVTLIDSLQRPVDATYADLNQDGIDDVVVCEFGFRTGRLSWHEGTGQNRFEEHVLRKAPGAVQAVVHDFNNDDRPDVMALFGQGDEGVFLYYNQGNGHFREERVLRFPPSYGSTYFELADFNGDGAMDIIYAGGDNADYRPIMKGYHGIRIFVNDGNNRFKEKYFYPLNGTYKTATQDYDQDGDLDIAAISFFPDYKRSRKESFVYLENTGGLSFEASTFAESAMGRWITLDSGDIDQDGDLDLILGAFAGLGMESSYVPDRLQKWWLKKGPSLVVLENTTN
jgi:hypothetical protein